MILDTVSRQLWSSLRTWLRKPQIVVPGLNSLAGEVTPGWWRAWRMLSSLKESAKGSPWWRVKRARTCSKVVMGKTSNVVGCDVRWKRCSAATASAWGDVKATRRIWVWGDNAQPGQSG